MQLTGASFICEGLSIPKALHIDVWEMAGVTAMAAGGEQTQSAHACDVSLGARIQHQIVNALELSTPTPLKNEKLFILVIGLVEKIGRTVKQCSDLKTSSIPLQSLEAQLSSFSLVTVLILFVYHVHCGSYQYSCFIRISSTVANRYRKSTSLLKHSVSITSIS